LLDCGQIVTVEVFDRVLDGHDVTGTDVIDVIDHRRERCGLSRTGRARHQDESAVLL
jgi:hypothetical protein